MKKDYNQNNIQEISTPNRTIQCFDLGNNTNSNIDLSVVESFGEEWIKFHGFDDEEISKLGETYFDIVSDDMLNKNSYALDAGCGSGRFSNYISGRAGFIEAIDPSHAVLAADKVIGNISNVRISRASISNIPFDDNTFDFVMSIGVLHHIPNTLQAMKDCVKKVKPQGYFYTYLYYNLDQRNILFKSIYAISTIIRKAVSRLPHSLKKVVCDLLAIFLYMPFVLLGRFLNLLGLKKMAASLPLSFYQNQSFFVIRNDSLDRFGTTLEQRFTKKEIIEMMEQAGLYDIVISNRLPYWHAVGRKK